MVHVAVGMVVVALTCIGLTVLSFGTGPDVSTAFVVGSLAALGTTSAFLAYVVRNRL
jgi:hypothetical protein